MAAPYPISKVCVPVSTTGDQCPELETDPVQTRVNTLEVAEAIHTLIEFGFTVGCDGELLPPRWVFGA